MSAGEIDFTNSKFIDLSGNNLTLTFPHATDSSKYLQYKDGASVGNTMNGNLSLQSTELGLHNPLYSQFSNSFDVGAYINTNFTIPAWTKYSISLWFKYTGSGNPTGYKAVLGSGSSGNNTDSRALIAFSGTNFYANIGTGTGAYWYDTSSVSVTELFDGNWHHIALSVFETGQNLYINGSLKHQYSYSNGGVSNPTTGFAGTSPYYINKFGSSGTGYLQQKIDELSFFDKKITDSEVLQIYNNGKPSDISSLLPKQWWRLGDSSYTNSSNYYVFPNKIANAPNGISNTAYKPSISADAPKVVAPGVSSGLVELDKKGNASNSTSNAISYNILKTDQSIYTPGYVSQYTVDNNYSMAFDGDDDYINAGNDTSLQFQPTDAFSLSCWFNADSYSSNSIILSNNEWTGAYRGYNIQLKSTGALQFTLTSNYVNSSNNTNINIVSTTTINTGSWYHLVITKDTSIANTGLNMYINGSAATVTRGGGGTISAFTYVSDFNIGGVGNGNQLFNGQIDEVAIFDTVLTADQIKFDIYEASATANKSADFINNPNLPDPVAWYRMGD